MYKQITELKAEVKLNNEGKEKMFKTNLADFENWDPRIKFFSLVSVNPGEEVYYHEHEGDSETYYFLSGKGIFNDNGKEVEIQPGMVTYTPSGKGHSVKNTGNEILT